MTISRTGTNSLQGQRGYVLLTLLLVVSLLAIAAAVAAPTIAFQIRRDREEELIHRGVQYSRAIRLFAKKTGRYPLSMQDLRQQGDIRYIRKLYKDPISGGDFKLLHTADIMAATGPPNLNNSPAQPGDSQNADSSDASSTLQNTAPPGTGLLNIGSQNTGAQNNGSQNSSFYTTNGSSLGTQPGTAGNGAAPNGNGSTSTGTPDDPTKGVFFGVVSTSKKQTIREFDHKNHYDQWLFFYDISHDRGYQITGPTSLSLTNASPIGQPAAGANQGPNTMQQSSTPQQPAGAQPSPQ